MTARPRPRPLSRRTRTVAEVDVDELGGVGERGRDDASEPVVSGIT
jgi:hypothetical protein